MRSFLIGLGLLLLSAAPTAAQERSLWAVTLDGLLQEDIYVVTTAEGPWVPVASLTAMGLRGFAGQRRTIVGLEHVLLPSLAPLITANFNQQTLELELTADPSLLEAQALTAVASRPPDLEFIRTPSSFLNYQVLWNADGGTAAALSGGLSLWGASLVSTAAWDTDRRYRRGLTSLTMDARGPRIRFEFGDVSARGMGGLSGGGLVGGFSIARENAIDPYYQPYTVPTFGGAARLPSQAELFVNGTLQRTFDLSPGAFNISGLPTTAGHGDIRVRVTDQNGVVQEFERSYYLATQLLARGRQDFRLGGGWKRKEGTSRVTYGAPMAIGGYRIGVTDRMTVGLSAEGDRTSQAAGLSLGLAVPVLGEIAFDASMSHANGFRNGLAGGISWQLVARGVSFSFTGRRYTDSFYGLDQLPSLRTRPWNGTGRMSFSLGGRASFFLQGAAEEQYDIVTDTSDPLAPEEIVISTVTRYGGGLDLKPFRRFTVRASAFRVINLTSDTKSWEASVSLSWSPGKKISTAVEVIRIDGEDTVYADINRPLPRGTGLGFRVRNIGALDTRLRRVQAAVEAQNSFGRVTVTHERDLGSASSTSVFAEGAIVQVGTAVALARPVTSSFAMVRVPETKGITVYRDNDRVGRTGRSHVFLVPNLQAYYGNILSIEDRDLPIDFLVDRTSAVVAPPYRGGALVVFPTKRVRAYMGTIRVEPWPADEPRYGTLTLRKDGTEHTSPLGADGSFYLENVPAGQYEVFVEMGASDCRMTLTIPAGLTMITTLGEVVCRIGGRP